MSKPNPLAALGARERQIIEAVYELGEGSVADVRGKLPDPPSYSAVRTMIRLLESKGLLQHRALGTKYVYRPTRSREAASRSALRQLMQTFFGGSATAAVAAILDSSAAKLSDEDARRLQRLIDDARER